MAIQDLIMDLHTFWAGQGCYIAQSYDLEVGAGTMTPDTFFRVLDKRPWKVAYVQPSRRPVDGRYGENPHRVQKHFQYQVIIKPSPSEIQNTYIESLACLGINLQDHDLRFDEDNWESPTIGAWGVGWQVLLDGLEITQFTYFQQTGGIELFPVPVEITYGLERLEMFLEGNLIDLIANNEQEIIDYFNGRSIKRFNGEELLLELEGDEITEISMSARQKFLLTISNPNLAYILFMIGLLGLYFEFSNPGAIIPGVVGAISLLLAIFAFQILPINYVGLMLILLAIGLFILEIKIQSYGILSIGGIISMIIGSTMLINSPIPELRPSLNFIIPVAIGVSLIIIFLIFITVRAHSKKASTGKEGLIGEIGTVQKNLNPEGTVFVHGEIWNAEAPEEIPKGAKVKVVEVLKNLKIKVIKIQ